MATVANAESFKKQVVLIADGALHSRLLLRSMLLQLGVKSIYEVGDGTAALDAIRTFSPDIMILDWDLPVLSGPDLMNMVRARGVFPNPDLPIIVISSSGQSTYVHEAIKLGAQQFLVRPYGLPRFCHDTLKALHQAVTAYAIKASIITPTAIRSLVISAPALPSTAQDTANPGWWRRLPDWIGATASQALSWLRATASKHNSGASNGFPNRKP